MRAARRLGREEILALGITKGIFKSLKILSVMSQAGTLTAIVLELT